MTQPRYATAQDAEDALYDALEEQDMEKFLTVWDTSDDIACLLPMRQVEVGRESVLMAWKPLFEREHQIDIGIRHLHWIHADQLAIHLVEEKIVLKGWAQPQPPVYATNIYRKTDNGWRVVMHQNSPVPPPPGLVPPAR